MACKSFYGCRLVIISFLLIDHWTNALHESCLGYLEGFSLAENYNPNSPPDEERFTVTTKIIIRDISKVIL